MFRLLWGGTLLTYAAQQMTIMARPWLAYDISGSGAALGLVAFAQGVPMLLLSPFGGVAADRLPKLVVMLVSQTLMMLMAATIGVLILLDSIEVWHLAVLAFVHGSTMPFNMPVRQSYIPLLVEREHLPNAVALNSSGRNLNQILGPSLAGVLLAWNPALAFFTIVSLHLVSMAVATRLPLARPVKAAGAGVVRELGAGFRYIWSSPTHRTLIAMMTIVVVLGMPYMQMLAVFQKDVLEVGPRGLGFMITAMGTGALTGSLVVASFTRLTTRGYPQMLVGIAFGLMLVAFALSPIYLLSLGLLFMTGFTSQSYGTINQTLLMTNTEPSLYGRVASVQMMTRSAMPLAILPMGVAVDAFGAPATVATAGAVLAATMLLIGLVRPSLWRERSDQAPP